MARDHITYIKNDNAGTAKAAKEEQKKVQAEIKQVTPDKPEAVIAKNVVQTAEVSKATK